MVTTVNGTQGVDNIQDGVITTSNIQDGAVHNVDINSLSSSKLVGALPAIDGSALTNLPSASKDYGSFYGAATGVTVGTSYAIVNIDSTSKSSSGSIFTLSADRITINKTATFMISYTITTDCTAGSARTESQAVLYRNGVAVPGTFSGMYNRLVSYGLSTGSGTIIVDVTSGDIFDIRALKTGSDTVQQVANGTNLTFLEL